MLKKSLQIGNVLKKQSVSWLSLSTSVNKQQTAESEYKKAVSCILQTKQAKGGEQFLKKALISFTNAAELGHIKAQNAIGMLYKNGFSSQNTSSKVDKEQMVIPKNEALAARFFQLAAEQGHSNSCHQLGTMHLQGKIVDGDPSLTVKYWQKAAEDGYGPALYDLGFLYDQGIHVEADHTKAFEYYSVAAKKGMPESIRALGVAYLNGKGIEKDEKKAFVELSKAAELGDNMAHYYLGGCYSLGKGVEKNMEKAANCFFLAAEAGIKDAQLILARMLETGSEGVPKDLDRANYYYDLAKEE